MEAQQNSFKGRTEMILELLSAQDRKFKDVINSNSTIYEEKVDIKFLLNVLKEYICVFELEESIMFEISYTKIEHHKEHHQYFIQKLEQFQRDYKTDNSTLISRVIIFMKKWLVSHIMVEHDLLTKEVGAFNFGGNKTNV